MKKNKDSAQQPGRLGRLLYNNKFLFAVSLCLAFVLWVVFAYNDTEHFPKKIDSVPISLKLSDQAQKRGLKVFDPPKTATASVAIRGNTLVVNAVSNKDIEVVPDNIGDITAPGEYKMALVGRITSALSNFDFDKIYPEAITLHVDYAQEKTYPLEMPATVDRIDTANYYSRGPTADVNEVTVNGPKAEVEKIDHIGVDYTPGDTALTESKTVQAGLLAYDENNKPLQLSDMVSLSVQEVTLTIPVQPKKTVPVKPTFTNVPAGMENTAAQMMSVSPSSIQIAGARETLDKISEIKLTALDFSEISPTRTSFVRSLSLPAGCTSLSSSSTAVISLRSSAGYATATLSVTNFVPINVPAGLSPTMVTHSLEVTVVGKAENLKALTASNLIANVDLSGAKERGTADFPVSIQVGSKECWAFGEYQATVNLQ